MSYVWLKIHSHLAYQSLTDSYLVCQSLTDLNQIYFLMFSLVCQCSFIEIKRILIIIEKDVLRKIELWKMEIKWK